MFKSRLCVFTGFLVFLASIATMASSGNVITVAKSGGDFTSIQAAINSVPVNNASNVTILIKNGTYEEQLFIDKSFISLVGESRENTIIKKSIARHEWAASHAGKANGCAVIVLGAKETNPITSVAVNDIVIGNMTIENTYSGGDTAKTMVIKDEGNSNRVYVVNCNVWCKFHDTISLWNKTKGMYYHANCSFKGSVDAVCPRGWCYAVECEFYETRSGCAPLWHEGVGDITQKFVIRNSKALPEGNLTFKLLNKNKNSLPNLDTLPSRFYLLDCLISDKATTKGTTTQAFFYNCHGEASDQDWFKNNLSTASGSPTQRTITAKWTFGDKWDPENEMPSVLPFAALPQPWNKAYEIPSDVQLKWVNARRADKHAIYFGATANPAFVKTQTENTYTPEKLATGTYYWRIDAITGSDTVKGAEWSFTVDASVGVEQKKSEIPAENKNFHVVQNANGLLNVTYSTKNNLPVMIKLFSIQGKEIAEFSVKSNKTGSATESLDLSGYNLSAGNYL